MPPWIVILSELHHLLEQSMWIDIDDIFPPRKTLVGLQFAEPEDFARAKDLIARDLTLYRELYPYWSMLVVRQADVERFRTAGLQFTEIEQVDEEDLPPEEVAEFYRELIGSWKPILRERLLGRQ
jgi:hypothetical protein